MLDRTNGEVLPSLGRDFVISPPSKWRDTPVWAEVTQRAIAAFQKKGALLPIIIDEQHTLIQEYHSQGRVAFIFARRIAGEWTYAPVVVALSADAIQQLRLANRWPRDGISHAKN